MGGRRARIRIDSGWEPRLASPERSRFEEPAGDSVVVLMPVYNDWESLRLLMPQLDSALAEQGRRAEVLIIDDGSTIEPGDGWDEFEPKAIERVDVLTLRRNLGHQRAIAVGLAYLEDCLESRAVVVMDSDGEDDPADVPRLLDALEADSSKSIIFAERTRRSESWSFRVFYVLYQLLHTLLTGAPARFGNFSVIPARRLASLVVVTELWNHYAAAVKRSRQPFRTIPTQRAPRLRGSSTMNFVGLVAHGLSAISVHAEVVGVRLLVASLILGGLTACGMCAAVVIRLATSWAVPGWATSTVGLLLVLLLQTILAAFVFSFMVLGARHGLTFLPRRDYVHFTGGVRRLIGPGMPAQPAPAASGREQLAREF